METKNITPIQRFWKLLKPDVKEIRNIHLYSIFSGLISLSLPLGIQSIVNLIQGGRVNSSWVILITFVTLGTIIAGVFKVFQLRITENLQQKIFTKAAFEFAYRVPRIRMKELSKRYTPELMNRFFDVISVQKSLSKILIDFSSAFFIVIFSLLLLSFYHPFFILFSVILLILIYFIFIFTAYKGMESSLQESKFKYKVVHWLQELSRSALTFKLNGKTNYPFERTDHYVQGYLVARENHFKVLIKQYSYLIIFKTIVTIGLLAIGGILVMKQQMNIGQFIAAEIIIIIVMSSVEKLILSIESIYDILTALEKIGQVTDLELDRDTGMNLEIPNDSNGVNIEVSNLSFRHPEATKNTLTNISFQINEGETLLITGDYSSGKSTLLQLLFGLYKPLNGTIAYNKLPIGNLSLTSLRGHIGEHLKLEHLFEGTILENITLGREKVSFKDVQWAIDNLGLYDFIKTQPKGYGTPLNAQGIGLPERTVIKLLLARSIVSKPKLLLLENTFEHLDHQTCKKIINFLLSKENKWTIILVSHINYIAQKVEKIIVLEKGMIINSGTYDKIKTTMKFKSN
ncbi:MAG: ATP-binding cassette domain-containing protein [Flavobacteriaceae bacterium]|nr:ATP-binding cassette domain-containing protein [Flavobacteriaceae bacterium]